MKKQFAVFYKTFSVYLIISLLSLISINAASFMNCSMDNEVCCCCNNEDNNGTYELIKSHCECSFNKADFGSAEKPEALIVKKIYSGANEISFNDNLKLHYHNLQSSFNPPEFSFIQENSYLVNLNLRI